MSSVNKAIIVGNLGKDPEIRTTPGGSKIATFNVATSERWTDKATGEKKERTEWHRVVIFNEALADIAEKYLKKGSKVYIEGQIQTRKWKDDKGIERYTTEVVLQAFRGDLKLLDSQGSSRPPAADSADDYGTTTTRETSGQATPGTGSMKDHYDDTMPF